MQGLSFSDPVFHGCALVSANANANAPLGGAVKEVSAEYRTWLHALFRNLAEQAGAKEPKGLTRQLVLLYDGEDISAWLDRDPSAETTARAVAQALVDAAIPASATRPEDLPSQR
ncbi:hypothetical protein ACQEVF_24075 [Nonomuraea polychroma]|uniref:hypothetical protein n=1 Tax=Nonomuraea polychroma TaxID=46176 RepID=UPI003D8C7870